MEIFKAFFSLSCLQRPASTFLLKFGPLLSPLREHRRIRPASVQLNSSVSAPRPSGTPGLPPADCGESHVPPVFLCLFKEGVSPSSILSMTRPGVFIAWLHMQSSCGCNAISDSFLSLHAELAVEDEDRRQPFRGSLGTIYAVSRAKGVESHLWAVTQQWAGTMITSEACCRGKQDRKSHGSDRGLVDR
jgi:hypothetical protein